MKIAWKVPRDFKNIIRSWDQVHKSPFSDSYYNCDSEDKDWGKTPIGCIRISDHWNFQSKGRKCCITDRPVNNYREWAMAVWDGKQYQVISKEYTCPLWELADDEIEDLSTHLKIARARIIEQRKKKAA